MRNVLRRWLSAAVLTAASLTACAPAGDRRVPYLSSASFRRSELKASLVDSSNGYSQLRLAHYASGDSGDWDALPEYNPPVELIAASELDAPGGARSTPLSASAASLPLPDAVDSEDDPALVELGRQAFHRYPVQLSPQWSVALVSREAAARYGLWVDGQQGVGGLVRTRMADGSGALMVTCSTCHASPGQDGQLADGLSNASLDTGAALVAAAGITDPTLAGPYTAWGPGRLDVTTAVGTEPARIPDLRPVRWLGYLQQDATVRAQDRTALAIRIETLLITSHDQVTRPPRIVALALAAYVDSLADGLPLAAAAASASPQGASVFAGACTGCHTPPELTGAPVPLAVIGTDPTLGESIDRGTGAYRVPSLYGVASRGPLFHDGTVPSLAALFDAARPTDAFTARLHGVGAVPGHLFGLDLAGDDREALLRYLAAL